MAPFKKIKEFFKELSTRNVFRVGTAYVVGSWFVLQIFDLALDNMDAPQWVMRVILMLLVLGFVISIVASWAFEITPEGIKREKDVVRDGTENQTTAKRLNLITIILLLITIMFVAVRQGDLSIKTDDPGVTNSIEYSEAISTTNNLDKPASNYLKDDRSIAVLPFANLSNLPENEPFTAGIHDDLLTYLSKIDSLKVISRTSVLRYRATTKSIEEIAKELGVANILEGGVQRIGNTIRINVQLIEAKTGGHIWAEKYDRVLTPENIFNMQSDITERISNALKAELTEVTSQQLQKVATTNLEAYNLVLAGRQRLMSRKTSDIIESESLFSKAIELDPNYAQAYLGLSSSIFALYTSVGLSDPELRQRVLPLIERTIELDPTSAEAYAALGFYFRMTGRLDLAEQNFKKALSYGPNNAKAFHDYSSLLRFFGRYEESLEMIKTAVELDPMSARYQLKLGKSLSALGRYEEALAQYRRTIILQPIYASPRSAMAWVYREIGRLDEAAIWQKRAFDLDQRSLPALSELGMMYLDLNMVDQVQDLLKSKDSDYSNIVALESLRNWIDLYLNDYQKALDNANDKLKVFENNLVMQLDVSRLNFVLGNYELAIKYSKAVFFHNQDTALEVNRANLTAVPELAYAMSQIGETETAKKLLSDGIELSLTLNPKQRGFDYSRLLAARGDSVGAAEAFSLAVDSGVRADWWVLDHFTYLDGMRKLTVYKRAYQRLTEDIARQRLVVLDDHKKDSLSGD